MLYLLTKQRMCQGHRIMQMSGQQQSRKHLKVIQLNLKCKPQPQDKFGMKMMLLKHLNQNQKNQ
jgi:hypothetical protein